MKREVAILYYKNGNYNGNDPFSAKCLFEQLSLKATSECTLKSDVFQLSNSGVVYILDCAGIKPGITLAAGTTNIM